MILNKLQYIIDKHGKLMRIPLESITAFDKNSNIIEVITPFTGAISAVMTTSSSRTNRIIHHLALQPYKANKVIDMGDQLYSEISEWNVYSVPIRQKALMDISRYYSGTVGIGFSFNTKKEALENALNFKGYFGIIPIPETGDKPGDYYICDRWNYPFKDNILTRGDILYWSGSTWRSESTFNIIFNSETSKLPVDPTIYGMDDTLEDHSTVENIYGAINELQDQLNNFELDFGDVFDIDNHTITESLGAIRVNPEVVAYRDWVISQLPNMNLKLDRGLDVIRSLSINPETYVVSWKEEDGTNRSFDLPIETMPIGISFNTDTGNLEIVLENGNTTYIDIGHLVEDVVLKVNGKLPDNQGNVTIGISDIDGLQTEIANLKNILNSKVDTKNTTGSTHTADKLFLIGAKVQDNHPQTYSHYNVYMKSGRLYMDNEVLVKESELNDYAKETWVLGHNYITIDDVQDYAKQSWVLEKGYLVQSDLTPYDTILSVNNKLHDHNTAVDAHMDIRNAIDALSGVFIYRGKISNNTDELRTNPNILTNKIYTLFNRLPQTGDVLVDIEGVEWYYTGNEWMEYGQGQIALADDNTDGLLEKGLYSKLNNLGLATSEVDGLLSSPLYIKLVDLPTVFAPVDAQKNVQSDWNQNDIESDDYIKNKPTHLFGVIEKNNDVKTDFWVGLEEDYEAVDKDEDTVYIIESDDLLATQKWVSEKLELLDIPEDLGSLVNVQSDWNQTNPSKDDYIKNKPEIPSLDGYATQVSVNNKNTIKETRINQTIKFWIGSESDYDGLATKDKYTIYYIVEE